MAEKKYIELEAAISSLDELEKTSHHNSVLWPDHVEECREALRSITAADVRPVVRGEWESHGEGFKWVYICSVCGFVDGHPMNDRMHFCPNCGADMRPQPPKEETT